MEAVQEAGTPPGLSALSCRSHFSAPFPLPAASGLCGRQPWAGSVLPEQPGRWVQTPGRLLISTPSRRNGGRFVCAAGTAGAEEPSRLSLFCNCPCTLPALLERISFPPAPPRGAAACSLPSSLPGCVREAGEDGGAGWRSDEWASVWRVASKSRAAPALFLLLLDLPASVVRCS